MRDFQHGDQMEASGDSADAGSSALRVVVLMSGSPTAVGMVRSLVRHEVRLAGLIVEARLGLRDCYRASGLVRRVAETPLAILRSIRRRVRLRLALNQVADGASLSIVTDRGNEHALRAMTLLRPDIVVLAGVGLVSREMLATPRLGTLNAHPALLPWVRGNGVVLHSIERGVAIGAACHRVDPGIDTGPVIVQRLLSIDTDDTLESLEQRAVQLASDLLAEVVSDAVARSCLPPGEMQRERFPLCRWAGPDSRMRVGRRIADGAAVELFHRWKACCVGDGLDLPGHIPEASVPPLRIRALSSSPHPREALTQDRC